METIKNYLDNIFANLPKTKEMERLKSEIYYNMEEKYNELKKAESLKMRQSALLFPNSAILMNCWRKWGFPRHQTVKTIP